MSNSRDIKVVRETLPDTLHDIVKDYVEASISENTKQAYTSQWGVWQAWCKKNNCDVWSGSEEQVAYWLVDRASGRDDPDHKPRALSTLRTGIAALKFMFDLKQIEFDPLAPPIKKTLAGIARKDARLPNQAPPVRADDIVNAIALPETADLVDVRNAALIACGYVFALRRSELVGLDYMTHGDGDGVFSVDRDNATVSLVRSKTSVGRVDEVVVRRDSNEAALEAIWRWADAAGIKQGTALFRRLHKGGRVGARLSGQSVARIMEKVFGKGYSGHSLRVGFAVTAAEAGADLGSIASVTRHRSLEMPRRYSEKANKLKTSPYNLPGVGIGKKGE